jgi:agmatine deiminase
VVAFTPAGGVLVQGCADPANANSAIAAENVRRLEAAGLDVTVVPQLPYAEYAGQRLPVPYVNVYAGNGFVAVPVSGHPFDDDACALIGAHYPDRAVVPVPGVVLAYGGGGVHCITQQVPQPVRT